MLTFFWLLNIQDLLHHSFHRRPRKNLELPKGRNCTSASALLLVLLPILGDGWRQLHAKDKAKEGVRKQEKHGRIKREGGEEGDREGEVKWRWRELGLAEKGSPQKSIKRMQSFSQSTNIYCAPTL